MRKNISRFVIPRITRPQSNESKNAFGQSIILVLLGALISFISTIGSSFLASKYEIRKLSSEQKIQFEREMVSNITANLNYVENLALMWRHDSARKDTLGESKYKEAFINGYHPKYFRAESTQLMMYAYVDDNLCRRYQQLNDSLRLAGELAIKNLSNRGKAYLDGWIVEANLYSKIQYEFTQFIREFHVAILKQ